MRHTDDITYRLLREVDELRQAVNLHLKNSMKIDWEQTDWNGCLRVRLSGNVLRRLRSLIPVSGSKP